jgi:hypothetical protein
MKGFFSLRKQWGLGMCVEHLPSIYEVPRFLLSTEGGGEREGEEGRLTAYPGNTQKLTISACMALQ